MRIHKWSAIISLLILILCCILTPYFQDGIMQNIFITNNKKVNKRKAKTKDEQENTSKNHIKPACCAVSCGDGVLGFGGCA